MADKDPKLPPPPSSAADSSQGSLLLAQWLEPWLGRVTVGIEGNTKSVFAIQEMLAAALARVDKSDHRVESRIADLQLAFDAFVQRVEDLVMAQKLIIGTTVDARKALEEGRRTFDRAVEETGKHRLLVAAPEEEEGQAPRTVRVIVVKVTNFFWPLAARSGPMAVAWLLKLTGGGAVVAALGKIIHFYITHASSLP